MSKQIFIASLVCIAASSTLARGARAQSEPAPPPLPPAAEPLEEPAPPPPEPPPRVEPPHTNDPVAEPEEQMSEGRRIVVAYNTGFQWGLAPGVVFSGGNASFYLGVRFGYGFDTGKLIIVPGVKLSAYFTDPNVYLGMPVMKLVYPIDRFAPFVEGGAGLGYVAGFDVDSRTSVAAQTGVALLVGGGFMLHFSWKFGLGVEANYQVVTGTDFRGFGIGPILAIAF